MAFRKHTTRDGKIVYFWREKVPVKEADGRSSGDELSEARRLARSPEREKQHAGSKRNTTSVQVVPFKR
jgi:hypothetical protein